MPNLIEVQKNSYQWFLDEGLKEVFRDVSAITDYNGTLELTLLDTISTKRLSILLQSARREM